jgi:ABC-type siderophore export system fused ATPase/permease subunit
MGKAYVSMQRIQDFLNEDDVPDWASTLTASTLASSDGEVGFRTATFAWQVVPNSAPSPARFRLGPLDITFPRGKLTLICGATGSGKSALLAALLGGQSVSPIQMRETISDVQDIRVELCVWESAPR